MIKVSSNLWVGNSSDGQSAKVDCVLNVARDLHIKRGYPDIEYMQVGMVDGPGNLLSAYYAAVLSLATMMKSGKKVLVHCHEGKSRSMAVAVMYLRLTIGMEWDTLLSMIRESNDNDIPEPHSAHKKAFYSIDWEMLAKVVNGGE